MNMVHGRFSTLLVPLLIATFPGFEFAVCGPVQDRGAAQAAGVIETESESGIAPYLCYRTQGPILLDGALDEPSWREAPKSPRFVDMLTGRPGFFETRAAALWDETNLYVAFWVEEPFLEAVLTERDATIFRESDVEVFIDGGDCYYEFEINALNTIYEVFFIWQDAYSQKFRSAGFDVFQRPAYTFGGNHDRGASTFWRGTHPRGLRWAFTDWDFPGLRTAVRLAGTLNDPTDVDEGWTVEIAFPWSGMTHLAGGRSIPPSDGDEWRVFFGRFEKLSVGKAVVSPAWSWDPIGDNDNHIPERFTQVGFSSTLVSDR